MAWSKRLGRWLRGRPVEECNHEDAVGATAEEYEPDRIRGASRLKITRVRWCPRCGWSDTQAELV